MKKMMIWRNLKKGILIYLIRHMKFLYIGFSRLLRVKHAGHAIGIQWEILSNALHNLHPSKLSKKYASFFCYGGAIFSSIPITQMNVLGLEEGTGNETTTH